MGNRIPKPLYFYQRWKSATTGDKRQYYSSRLSEMGIHMTLGEEVIAVNGDIAIVGRPLADILVHMFEVNWKSGERHV